MCLTIPKQVIAAKKDKFLLRNGSRQETAGALIKVKKGDWVLTQNNVIIKKMTAGEAAKIKVLLKGDI